jgi:EAL domain-containing protein (putative c-di-GMP-specific phosphodiesterase class I)
MWYLEGYFGGSMVLSRLPITHFPFQIGRSEGMGFAVPSGQVSRLHAEITLTPEGLKLEDFGSTNGTFVNRNLISGVAPIQHGDVLHFGDVEVRLCRDSGTNDVAITDTSMTAVGFAALPENLPTGLRELQEMLEKRMLTSAYQAILHTSNEEIFGYEMLGRGGHPGLVNAPGPLFQIAESVHGMALNLSKAFRDIGVELASGFESNGRYFINIHPFELDDIPKLISELEAVRKAHPHLQLVVEVHEQCVCNLEDMRKLREELEQLDIEIAYDDFGAGQARLLELVDAPAHYLKFDMALVRDIDKASDAKHEMIALLLSLAKKMGAKTLAEGVEREGEVQMCRALGFDFVQGFYYGMPTEGALTIH